MRGDSLRDLYAKTLAVMGLGLLAGAGAVVDYWPIGGTMPAVRAAAVPTLAGPVLVQDLTQQIPPPDFSSRPAVRARIRPSAVGRAIFYQRPDKTVARVVDAVDVTLPASDVIPVSDAWPEALSASAVDVAQLTASPAAPQPAPAATGFFTGAVKKTKDSIVRTGAATRASISDALKGVAGGVTSAFKKVTPF